jgi:hypothetical protein
MKRIRFCLFTALLAFAMMNATAFVHINLGYAYSRAGRTSAAVKEYQERCGFGTAMSRPGDNLDALQRRQEEGFFPAGNSSLPDASIVQGRFH